MMRLLHMCDCKFLYNAITLFCFLMGHFL
uniref:Uncharacterized protein n=1 Tax=Rhizophora mucronata TaxID=61149 RepID=A0A2P2JIV4_RHIMU